MTLHLASRANADGKKQDPDDEHKRVDKLIRHLIDRIEKQGARPEGCKDRPAEEIILDRTVDAVRYLLIRMPSATQGHAPLSPREHEIVRMVADGHPTKVIAGVLNISCWTVTAHLRRIFIKLGVTSRPAMVARLLEEGRTWDMPVQRDQPLSDTTRSADYPSQRPANATPSRISVRV